MPNLCVQISDEQLSDIKKAAENDSRTVKSFMLHRLLGVDMPDGRRTNGRGQKTGKSSAQERTVELPFEPPTTTPEKPALSDLDQTLADAGMLDPNAVFG